MSTILDGEKTYPLVVWFTEGARDDPATIGETILDTPSGRKVALSDVAEVQKTNGPNTVNRERVERRIVVSCNVQGRDLGSVVRDIQRELRPVEETLPSGYRIGVAFMQAQLHVVLDRQRRRVTSGGSRPRA